MTDRGLQVGSLIVAGDRMLAVSANGENVIARLNPSKFEVLNREQIIGGKTWTMPVLANGLFYARNARGDLFAQSFNPYLNIQCNFLQLLPKCK